MKQNYFSLMLIFVLIAASCKNEKETLISDFEKLVKKASNEYVDCNEVTWKRQNDEFKKLDNKYSQLEKKMSEREKERIDELKGRFYSIIVKYNANQLKKQIKSEYDKAKGFLNEFFKDP